jgi:predicted dehydrogenase
MMGHGGRPGMETEWKLKLARAGGGALIDPGIHLVDLSLHLFGAQTVENVGLHHRFWKSDVEDSCALSLKTAGGADISIGVTLTSWRNQFVIEAYGSDGMAVLTGRGANYGTQKLEYVNRWFWQGTDNRSVQDLGTEDPSFELETRAFLDLIANGKDDGVLSDAAAGCAAMTVVRQAYDRNGPITF